MNLVGAAVVAVATAAVGLAGCSAEASPPASTVSPGASQSASSAPTSAPTPAPTSDGLINDDTGEVIGQQEPAQWSDEARSAARVAADGAMRAFARPGIEPDQWWDELEPLLTAAAAEDYAYVDPANVPARKVNGSSRLTDETSAYIARAAVPTDAGTYTVVLSRSGEEAPWLVERFTPPEEGR